MTSALGRHRFAPWGVAGGRDGTHNYVEITYVEITRPDGRKEGRGRRCSAVAVLTNSQAPDARSALCAGVEDATMAEFDRIEAM